MKDKMLTSAVTAAFNRPVSITDGGLYLDGRSYFNGGSFDLYSCSMEGEARQH